MDCLVMSYGPKMCNLLFLGSFFPDAIKTGFGNPVPLNPFVKQYTKS